MLEALQDIEIASKLVGFDADNDDSLDDKYKKLQCEMVPLPHESEDYRLVEKYLQTTHAPTHTVCLLSPSGLFSLFIRTCILKVGFICRIGHLNSKKFLRLKDKGSLISFPLTKINSRTRCSFGTVGFKFIFFNLINN